MSNRVKPVAKMCGGCARDKGSKCAMITEPAYIFEARRKCWAKMDKATADRIELELADRMGKR